MLRIRFVLAALAAGALATLGCQGEEGPLSSEPLGAFQATADPAEIRSLIEALFDGGNETAMLKRFRDVERQLARGQTHAAIAQGFAEIGFILHHHGKEDLTDPNGNAPPTKEEAAAELITLILEFLGYDVGEGIPPGALTEEGALAMCHVGQRCEVVTGTGFAGVVFPKDALSETIVVFIARLPDTADPFEPFGFDDFPLFFEFGSIPETTFGGPVVPSALALAQSAEVVAGVCVVDPPDPLAPPEEIVPDLRLAHLVEGAESTEVEITPLRDAPFLDCTDASTDTENTLSGWGRFISVVSAPIARALDVPPLFAHPGNLGGAINNFSPFGGVDQNSFDEGSPPEITSVDFPAFHPTTAGILSNGTVGFSDPDGDIVRAIFAEVSDPNGAFPGGFDIDPGVSGQTSGEFLFQMGCPAETPCPEGPVTLSVQLEDADGNLSEAATFSFDIVDPSTTTTLVLDDSSLFHGQTATATATVTPAPDEGESPMVRFVVDANTVNLQQVEKPLVGGQANATIFCDFFGGATSEADLEIGQGTHTIRAFFLGTTAFEGSASVTRFITCQAPIE